MTVRKWPLSILALVVFAACSKDNGNSNNNNNNNNGGTAGPLFTAAKAVVQTNCAISGCHAGSSPQSGINFSNEDVIIAQKARIKARAVDAAGTPTQMPPPPSVSLSVSDRQKITDWVAAGGRKTD